MGTRTETIERVSSEPQLRPERRISPLSGARPRSLTPLRMTQGRRGGRGSPRSPGSPVNRPSVSPRREAPIWTATGAGLVAGYRTPPRMLSGVGGTIPSFFGEPRAQVSGGRGGRNGGQRSQMGRSTEGPDEAQWAGGVNLDVPW